MIISWAIIPPTEIHWFSFDWGGGVQAADSGEGVADNRLLMGVGT